MMIHQQQLLFPNMKFHLVKIIYIGVFAGMLYIMKIPVRWLQKRFLRFSSAVKGGLYEQQRI